MDSAFTNATARAILASSSDAYRTNINECLDCTRSAGCWSSIAHCSCTPGIDRCAERCPRIYRQKHHKKLEYLPAKPKNENATSKGLGGGLYCSLRKLRVFHAETKRRQLRLLRTVYWLARDVEIPYCGNLCGVAWVVIWMYSKTKSGENRPIVFSRG